MMRALLALLLVVAAVAAANAAVRIKDITSLRGVRDNQLVGYGLVVGLQGTGDSLRNAPFTEQAMQSMLDRMGCNVRSSPLRNRNVAAVIVTADLALGADAGQRLDVTVSSLGDATSLMGGTLIMTPLMGGDGQTLRHRAGRRLGHRLRRRRARPRSSPRACRPPAASPTAPSSTRPPAAAPDEPRLTLELRNPDFKTAVRITDAINAFARKRLRPADRPRAGRALGGAVPARPCQRRRASWRRSATCWSSPTRRRASSSTRAPARS